MELHEKLGIVMKQLREQKGLTVPEFAKKAGITAQYITCLEHGKNKPTLGKLEQICKAFDIKVSFLLKMVEDTKL